MSDVFHVVAHSPGEAWVSGVAFHEQAGIDQHVAYWAGLAESGDLLMGGPFLDGSGGMMILSIENRAAAERIAIADPCVGSGLLGAEVKPWRRVLARPRRSCC